MTNEELKIEPKSLDEVTAEAKTAYTGKWRGDYAKFQGGDLTAVACKFCGAPIRALKPAPEKPISTQRIRNQTIIRQRYTLQCLANYREALIEMEDGSAHVTCVCVSCLSELNDPSKLEAAYAMDLEALNIEGGGYVSEYHVNRKPVQVIHSDYVIM